MTTTETNHSSRRKCLKPVPLRGLEIEEMEQSTLDGEDLMKQGELRTLTTQQVLKDVCVNCSPAEPIPSSTELVKTSPRSFVKKAEEIEQNGCNLSKTLPITAKKSDRPRAQKRMPLAETTKKQAAKKNRLDGAISQLETKVHRDTMPAVKDNNKGKVPASPAKPNELPKIAPKKRRQRKAKNNTMDVPPQSSVQDFRSEQEVLRQRIQEIIKEVFEICSHSNEEKVVQAILDVMVEGVPLAISAARQGFTESYLKTFIQATFVHIRQQYPDLLQNLAE